jgi:hypothetical protein
VLKESAERIIQSMDECIEKTSMLILKGENAKKILL